MPNQLAIPFKLTQELDIKRSIREFINDSTDAHPDEFKTDLHLWQSLRKDATANTVRVDRVNQVHIYQAQLAFALTKLPVDVGLDVSYTQAFQPRNPPLVLRNMAYERAAVVFNLAALYSQLSNAQDRVSDDGIKRAKAYYENAAGALSYLASDVLPELAASLGEEDVPIELSESFLKSLEWLMLAQAQECAWQLVMMNSHVYKNGVVAKLSAQTSTLYGKSLNAIQTSPLVSQSLPKDWIAHIEVKMHHFQAAAQWRKSMDDLDANRYGAELGRLYVAQRAAKKGHELAKSRGVAQAVTNDISALLATIQKNITRAERDNDLIYHDDVPDESNLPSIDLKGSMMCGVKVPMGLSDPKTLVGEEQFILRNLLGWAAREAISIYNHNKDTLIKDEIVDCVSRIDSQLDRCLRELNLPASLEALERPIGLPPSLLRKAEEVRTEDGVAKIETWIESVQTLAQHVSSLLEEAMDILDNEASEDENARMECDLHRPTSHIANKSYIDKGSRYREILEQANASDALVRSKWEEWEQNIIDLTADEKTLEASVPSSANQAHTSHGAQTSKHARTLRRLLEQAEEGRQNRAQLVDRAKRVAEADDITQLISRKATGFEQFADVQPFMFEDVSDRELGKYDRFVVGVKEAEEGQEQILGQLRIQNEEFLRSRKENPVLKEREHALQSLDLAYHKYREITKNLDEGIKFYNGLSEILTEYKQSCEVWSRTRKLELQTLVHERSLPQAMKQASLNLDRTRASAATAAQTPERPRSDSIGALRAQQESVDPSDQPAEPESISSKQPGTKRPVKATLKFDADDWEELKLPDAPVQSPSRGKSSRKKVSQQM